MLSFNFNRKKEQGVKRVQTGDKALFEGWVQACLLYDWQDRFEPEDIMAGEGS